MKDKLNQFISNINGQFIEVSSKEAIYQCMDLAYLWTFCLGFPKSTIQSAAAYQVFSEADDLTRQYFELFVNTVEFIPQAGDLFVIGKSTSFPYGHIGVVIEATKTKMRCFEQNYPTGTNAHIQERSYTNVVGFLRPKVTFGSITPQWLLTLLQERGLTLENESEIRSLFEKAKKYDDDIKALQEQVKSANEALADRSLEVSSLTGQNQSLTGKVQEFEKLYSDAKTERDGFEWDSKKVNIQNEELQRSLTNLNKELEDLKVSYNVLQSQKVEDLSPLKIILIGISKLFKGGEKNG